jgi:predicted PurR-regulated permease PerM
MLVDSGSLRQQALRLFPKHLRERANAASLVVMEKISAWLIGQLLLAGTIGASSAIGLWALGIPFFYVLALLSAIGEMIPIVGPILSAIPAIAVASTLGLQKVIAVIIFFLVQQQLENHILVPKIMSRQVGVSPVTVIISLLIGGALMGVVGALLAVPTAAILQVIAAEIVENDPGGQSTKTSKK